MDTEMEQWWGVLKERMLMLRKMLEGDLKEEFLSEEYMDTYTIVYNIANKMPCEQKLYDRYKNEFEEYMALILPYLRNCKDGDGDGDGEVLLREFMKRWEIHNGMVKVLSDWFSILDRSFVILNELPPLTEVGLVCFREQVYHEIKHNAKNAVLRVIHKEREGKQIDRSLLKNVLKSCVEIGMDLYQNDFEAHILEETRTYYSTKAALWILVDSFPDYMRKAEDCLEREEDGVAKYLHSSSKQRLLEIVRNELLSHYQTRLLENEHTGVHFLLREDQKHDLKRMYRLFCKITNGLEPIANLFMQQLSTEGIIIVNQAEEDAASQRRDKLGHTFVRKVIQLHHKYMEYVEDAFQNNCIFSKPLKLSFEVICGKGVGGITFAEILATFCDNLLKKERGGKEGDGDGDIENMLEKVVKILEYTGDKDVFAQVYRKKLAFRLLFDESRDISIEESILPKLKEKNGNNFISNIEGMITDLKLAKEGKSKFDKYLIQSPDIDLGIEFRVKTLTTKFWPTFQFSEPNLPPQLLNCAQVFKAYYSGENKYRKLTWIYSLGTCYIDGHFENMKVEMIVTTSQAIMLLLFNDHEKLNYAEIKSQLNLTDEEVVKLLHSLVSLKHKILLKQPNTKIVATDDTFQFNSNFTSKLKRIQIPYPLLEEKKNAIDETVQNDRKDAIHAAIVRIMKSRKVLHQSQLVSECIHQLGGIFKPDVQLIEKMIIHSISKGFVEHDQQNSHLLRYVA